MEAVSIANASQAPAEVEKKGKAEKKSGKRIGYNYIIIKSLKESQKNDVVKCLYIKSLTNFGFCVIKEGTYGDTKDKHGRDIKDRLIWQKKLHEMLQDKVRVPRLLGSFEENGNYYLVIEHIKGEPFWKVCKDASGELRKGKDSKMAITLLDYLIQIVSLLENLHKHQIVHRDATSNNFMITPNGKVAVIDMELSYSLKEHFPSPPFQLGTFGFMSPQQEALQIPTEAEDIFSIGAVILQAWATVSPSKVTNEPMETLIEKVLFLIPDQQIAEIVIQCLQPDPLKRPLIPTIREQLLQCKIDYKRGAARNISKPTFFTKEEIFTTIQESVDAFSTPWLADTEKGWFAENLKPPPGADKHKFHKVWYASFNRGAAGIIYMLSQAKKTGFNIEPTSPFIQKGIDLINEKYIRRIEQTSPGLHFGSDGIAVSLAVAIEEHVITATNEILEWIDLLLEKSKEQLGIFSGIAGQGIANLLCAPFISRQKLTDRLERYTQQIINAQQKDGSWIHSVTVKKEKSVLYSLGEGMAGPIYFLLAYFNQFKHEESLNAAKRGLRRLIQESEQTKENGLQWRRKKNKPLSYWWADGLAGIALTYIKAYEVTGDAGYKNYAIKILNGINPEIIGNDLSQSYGLSGLGEVYIEAYKVFGDEQWLQRAFWIAQVIMQLKKRHNEYGTYWIVCHERQAVPDFMTGNSGVIHFLLRCLAPDTIKFPMLSC